MLVTWGYKYTLRLRNTYCFSTATWLHERDSKLRYICVACLVHNREEQCLLRGRSAPLNVIQAVLSSDPTIPTISATYIQLFLLTFARPRKATVSFVMPVRSPLRPHEITLLALDGFLMKLYGRNCIKICPQNSNLIGTGHVRVRV
jgi:hypothetical protein